MSIEKSILGLVHRHPAAGKQEFFNLRLHIEIAKFLTSFSHFLCEGPRPQPYVQKRCDKQLIVLIGHCSIPAPSDTNFLIVPTSLSMSYSSLKSRGKNTP